MGNDEFLEAVAQMNEIHVGKLAAQAAVLDALLATLVKSFPPLADPLLNHLEITAKQYRGDLVEEDTLSHQAFDNQITAVQILIDAVRPKS